MRRNALETKHGLLFQEDFLEKIKNKGMGYRVKILFFKDVRNINKLLFIIIIMNIAKLVVTHKPGGGK